MSGSDGLDTGAPTDPINAANSPTDCPLNPAPDATTVPSQDDDATDADAIGVGSDDGSAAQDTSSDAPSSHERLLGDAAPIGPHRSTQSSWSIVTPARLEFPTADAFDPTPDIVVVAPLASAGADDGAPVGEAAQPASAGGGAIFAAGSGSDPVSDTADEVVQGDAARSTYDVDGTGIKIGIISDSFNLDGGAAADEADGALPPAADVTILKDGTSGDDEGRAMAQIVHSIAPGAQIYFYTCGDSDASMAQAITALQQAGCQLIVDDVSFLDEPFYEEGGTISQAVNQVVADGTTYFTASNNFADSYYEGTFNPIAVPAQGGGTVEAEDFNVAGAPDAWLEPLTIPLGATVIVDLQWNQPFATADGAADGPGSANSLGYNILNSSGHVVSSGTVDDVNGDPLQFGEFTNNGSSTTFYLDVFQNVATGPLPGEFKIIVEDDSFSPVVFDDPNAGIGSGDVFGHEEDPNAITVGAVPESHPTTLEPFTSTGPGEFLFSSNGTPLAAPVSADKNDILAPDGNTTSTALDPFYGTSAAAPAATAVGALMLEANPALDPSDIANLLEDSATPVAGSPTETGAGLVDALAAVGLATTLTFSLTASTGAVLGTHLGDTFIGGPGNHVIDGEGGVDTLDYSSAPGAVAVDFATGIASNGYGGTDQISGIDIVKGSAFADSFITASTGETVFGDGGLDTVDFSDLAATGLLALDGGIFTTSTGDNAGTVDVTGGTSLDITGPLDNTGDLLASDGDITIAGAVSGAGSEGLASGGLLEIGGSDAQNITFGSGLATLKFDQPSSFGGVIAGLALGDIIDLAKTVVASTILSGSTLTITESGGTTLHYQLGGVPAGDSFAIEPDGAGGDDLVLSNSPIYNLAQASVAPASPINLGNTRVGGTLQTTLGVTNGAVAPAEGLDGSIAGVTGAATASGSFSLLGPGKTDASDIIVGLATTNAGAQTGSVTLGLQSDGTGTDGQGTTSLPSQTVTLTGSVFREATAAIGALPQNFIVHVGDTVSQALTITNSATADAFSENLIASAGSTTGGVTVHGSTGDIAAQGSSNAITIGFATTSAGTISGGVTVNLQSDGTGIDGLGPTAIGAQTVTVNATVDNYASAAIEKVSGAGTLSKNGTTYTLSLGTVARGSAPIAVNLGVLNSATGQADLLSGSFTSTVSSAFSLAGLANFSGLASGQADTQPSVTFSTGTGGTFTETITLASAGSNASGYSGALATETLNITGTVAATITWAGPSSANRSGSWNTVGDWSPAVLPTAQTTAVISAAGTYTVTSTQSNSVGTLTLTDGGATLAVAGGTFAILGNSTDAATIAVSDGATLQLTGTLTDTGTIALASTGDATDLTIAGNAMISGAGSVTLGGSADNAIVSNGVAAALTNKTTIAGSGTIGDSFLTLVNGTGATIDASSGTVALTLAGTNAVSNLGLIEATGSAGLIVATTITGSTGGLIAAAGANVYLEGATLNGDTLQTSAGSLIETLGGANVLIGTTSAGSIVVGDGTTLSLKSTITNNGTIAVNSTGDATALAIAAATTLKGSGSVVLGGSAANAILSNGTSETLTNDETIAGSGTIGDSFLTLVNSAGATIDANGATTALTLAGTHGVTNSGLIEATGSAGLIVATTITGSTGGVIAATGANVYLDGATLNGDTLQTSAGSLIETLGGANVLNGTTSSGSVVVSDGTTLTLKGTVTNNGTIALNSTGDATALAIAAATTLKGSGSVALGSSSANAILSNGTTETLTNDETIAGSGTIGDSFLTVVNAAGATIDASAGSVALTLAGTHVVTNSGLIEATGSAGLIVATTITGSAGGLIAAAGANVYLDGATLNGDTLQNSAGGLIETLGGTNVLSGTTSTGSVVVSNGTTLTLKGTVTNNGTISLNSTGAATAVAIAIAAATTLKGSGSVSLGGSSANTILSNGTNETLTNDETIAGSGTIGDSFLTLVNGTGATIDATGATVALILAGTHAVTNSGLIEATGSAGLIVATTITGAAGGLIAAAGADVYLDGATLNGDTLQNSAGGLIETLGGTNVLSGTTSTGSVVVSDGTTLTLKGTVTNNGTIALNSTGDATALAIAAATTLKGSGSVALGGSSANAILSNGTTETLTNDETIAGSGTIGDSFLTVVNAAGATIDASAGSVALTLAGTHGVANSGLIEATGSAGLIVATLITGSTGVVAAAGANIYLEGAAFAGGTLQSSAGDVIETISGANTLSGVTSTGSVVVSDGTSLTLRGTITDTGTIALGSTGDATALDIASTVTLQGSGQVAMTGASSDAILSNGTGATLVNSTTIDGAGTIGDSHLTLNNAVGGVIDANAAAALAIASPGHTVSNSGLIEATASGGLSLAGALTNNGTLAASGGALTVTGAVSGTGQATIAGATLDFGAGVVATQSVTFAQGSTGTLALGLAQSFAGTVAGLAAGDTIDLTDFQFASNPTITAVSALTQSGSTIGAAVTVKDGTLTATVDLLNQFGAQMPTAAAGYVLASDATGAHSGTILELAPPVAA